MNIVKQSFINAAVEASKKSNYDIKIGAVIFKKNRILSIGFNSVRSCSSIDKKFKRFEHTLHAEAHALSQIKDKSLLKGASILIVRVSSLRDSKKRIIGEKLLLAKPCEYCEKMLRYYDFKDVYYTNNEDSVTYEKY